MRRLLARALLAASIGITVIAMSATAADMTADSANSIKLNLLKYKEVDSQDRLATSDSRWNATDGNYHLNPNPIDGFRPASAVQRDPADASTATTYPVKTQFLAIATVPSDATEVTWNLSGHEADVYAVPDGSRWVDGSHLVTPVAGALVDGEPRTIRAVPIENPQYVSAGSIMMRNTWAGEVANGLRRALDSGGATEHVAFYQGKGGDGTEVEPRKPFEIGVRQTYIVITSSEISDPDDPTDVTDIVASCNTADPREATVYAAVSWVPQKPVGGGAYEWGVNLVQYGRVDLEASQPTATFYVKISNNSRVTKIPTALLAFGLQPTAVDGKTAMDWWQARGGTPVIRAGSDIRQQFEYVTLDTADPPNATVVRDPGVIEPGTTVVARVVVTAQARSFDPTAAWQMGNSEVYVVGPTTTSATTARVVFTGEPTTVIPGPITESTPPDVVTELMTGGVRVSNFGDPNLDGDLVDVYIDGALAAPRVPPKKLTSGDAGGTGGRVEIRYRIEVHDARGEPVLGDERTTHL